MHRTELWRCHATAPAIDPSLPRNWVLEQKLASVSEDIPRHAGRDETLTKDRSRLNPTRRLLRDGGCVGRAC